MRNYKDKRRNRAPFIDRVYTQTLTPEFLQEFVGVTGKEAEKEVRDAARQVERNYNVVVGVSPSGLSVEDGGFIIDVIPSLDTNEQAARRALEEIYYHLD